jgi:hypothetical protein
MVKKKTKEKPKPTGKPAIGTNKNGHSSSDIVAVPIRHEIPDDLPSHFCNHFVVQHDDSVFRLMFFEMQPPLLIGDEEARRAEVGKLVHVTARCVARIIVPADLMPSVLTALSSNIEKQKTRASAVSSFKALTNLT